MILHGRQSKTWLHASWLVYAVVLLVFASLYFKERSLFLDNAFLLFRLIQDEGIVINAYRWPAAIYRILPYFALKLGLSIKTLMWCLSISYVIIPVIIQAYISLCHKNLRATLVFAFLSSTVFVHGFFWNNSELILCIQLIILLVVCIESHKTLFTILLATCIAWLHPLSILGVGFMLCLKYISGTGNRVLVKAGLIFGVNYASKALFFPNWYDTNKKAELLNNLQNIDLSIFSSLLDYILNWDQLLPMAFVLVLGFLIFKQNYKQIILLSAFSLMSLFLFIVSNPRSELGFYNEINNYLLFLFLALCLMEGAAKIEFRNVFIVISIFMLIASYRWIQCSTEYSERIEWYQDRLEQEDRIIYINPTDELNSLILPWASAYESLLISSMGSTNSKSLLFTDNRDKAQFEGSSEILITEYMNYRLDSLNKDYFKLDKKPYQLIYLD